MQHPNSNKSNEYAKAQALFTKLKNENDVVATSLLNQYLREQGMSDDEARRALDHIDQNHDNELTWAEFATKGIRIIDQLRLHEEAVQKAQRRAHGETVEDEPQFGVSGGIEGETQLDARANLADASAPIEEGDAVTLTETTVTPVPNGVAVETTETTVAPLPNGDMLVETKKETVVAQSESAAGASSEIAKEAEKLAAAAAAAELYERIKTQVITEAKQGKAKEVLADKKFELGEQPNWAGTDACVPQPADYIPSVISEGVASLNKRGYAIIELPTEVSDAYSDFHAAFEAFSQSPLEHKQKYATQQFDTNAHSPNQFHGFSVVDGLKEQFMMRLCGPGTLLTTPGSYHTGNYSSTEDMGRVGMKLYEYLDQICRKVAHDAVKKLGIAPSKVDILLDPVHQIGKPVERDAAHPDVCFSHYVPDGFVSSSIMDNFHYYNTFDKPAQQENGGERFYNNHSAHTDSGLLTVVVTTDEPGLEVYDQQLKQWIALEHHLHQHVKTTRKNHREYATIFWADSVSYLKAPGLQPCLHRVGKSTKERYSVVFKQRTSTLTTPCRYQEDYVLADIQKKAMQGVASKGFSFFVRHPLVLGTAAMAIALAIGTYLGRPKLL
eukprot:Phypoly_transcript_03747.p1 GENE.Phypoly_transcript_03747~~Phypoly_transcript_03747.p1  ORF type:complete len:611 (+),score=151.66 Phypoly_transcript_03747:440-2272(+)